MADSKKRRVENVAAAIQQQYGPQALRRGSELGTQAALPHVSTGFPGLDAITGCNGVPLGMITLVSGRSTSGKLTLAHKILANAQRPAAHVDPPHPVALLDLSRTADPDYMTRCGVDLNALLIGQPPVGCKAAELLGDLVQQAGLRALVVDSLADLARNNDALRTFNAMLPRLQQMIRSSGCALVVLDEPHAPWLRWLNLDGSSQVRGAAALHIEMQREQWLHQDGDLIGYQAQARLLKSRWAYGIRSARVEIVFNGTIKARDTW